MATLRMVQRQAVKTVVKPDVRASAKATTTVTTEVRLRPEVRRKLLTELTAYAKLKGQIKPLKTQLDKATEKVRAIRESVGERSISIEGFKTTDVPGETTFFDKDEFVMRGGDLALYNDCLKKKPKKAYEKITLPGEKESIDA